MSYFDCALIPVRSERLQIYKKFSAAIAQVYREHGAIRVVDCVIDSTADDGIEFHAEDARQALQGSVLRDFHQAAATVPGETIILSWTEWPDKATRDLGLKRALADPRVQPKEGEEPIFEGRRLVAGAFQMLLGIPS